MASLTYWQHWFSLTCGFLFLHLNEERFRFFQASLWPEFPTITSISLLWTCGQWNLLITVCQQVFVGRDQSMNTWTAQSVCSVALSAEKAVEIRTSTCSSHLGFPLCCGWLRHFKAGCCGCVSFSMFSQRAGQLEKWEVMRQNWRNSQGKLGAATAFVKYLVIFNPDLLLCCFRMAVFIVYSTEKLP